MNVKFLPILVAILVLGAASHGWAVDTAAAMKAVDPETASYVTPPSMPECAKMTVLSGDPAKGASMVLAKMASGCVIPWHWHTPTETLMLVSGSGQLEMKGGNPFSFKPGAYLSLPSHHIHQATCGTTECVMFISSDAAFDIHYVDKKGREIPMAQALKTKAKW